MKFFTLIAILFSSISINAQETKLEQDISKFMSYVSQHNYVAASTYFSKSDSQVVKEDLLKAIKNSKKENIIKSYLNILNTPDIDSLSKLKPQMICAKFIDFVVKRNPKFILNQDLKYEYVGKTQKDKDYYAILKATAKVEKLLVEDYKVFKFSKEDDKIVFKFDSLILGLFDGMKKQL